MIAEKVPTEEPKAKAGKRPADARLDDFILLGRYSLILCCLSEALILSQLGNMFFMMYAGKKDVRDEAGCCHVYGVSQTAALTLVASILGAIWSRVRGSSFTSRALA